MKQQAIVRVVPRRDGQIEQLVCRIVQILRAPSLSSFIELGTSGEIQESIS
jgi:hypothetical protein